MSAGVDALPDMLTRLKLTAMRDRLDPDRVFALTTRGTRLPSDTALRPGDWFVFGPESRGLPDELLDRFGPAQRLRLPMRPRNRSLNLSNAVAVTVFEAWRQNGFAGAG